VRAKAGDNALITKSGARSATKGRGGEGGVPDLLRLGAKQSDALAGTGCTDD